MGTLPPMFATSAAIFSLLLLVTGVAKIGRPRDVARAIGEAGLAVPWWSGIGIGMIEVAVGIAALFHPGGLLAQGIMYVVFAGWVAAALRLDVPLATCGCLGKDDTPPSAGHLGLNLLAAVVSLAAAGSGPIDLIPGLGGVAQIFSVVVGVFLSYIVLTDGARLGGARIT